MRLTHIQVRVQHSVSRLIGWLHPPCYRLFGSCLSHLMLGDGWSCNTNTSPVARVSSPPGRPSCQTAWDKRWLPPTVCLQHVRLSKHQLPGASPRLWLMRWSWADLLTLPGWPGPTGSTHTTKPPVNDSAITTARGRPACFSSDSSPRWFQRVDGNTL